MTRESKLALVLGFSLMLFVLILVSDHMAARNPMPVAIGTTTRQAIGVPPIPPPGGNEGDAIVVQLPGGPQIVDPTARLVENPTGAGVSPDQVSGTDAGAERAIVMGGPVGGTPTPGGIDAPIGGGPESSAGQRTAPQVTPSVKTYTVRKGDTFAAIAAAEYKKRSLGDKLAAFNGIKPSKLQVGDTIKLPRPEELDPALAGTRVASGDQGRSEGEGRETRSASNEPVFRSYRVKEGDTLYRIAERELGTPNRWKELRSANTEVLKGGSSIHPGMTIRIPERQLAGAATDA
jgi:nucleoid-associated protein YgaU